MATPIGPLHGLKVVELAGAPTAFVGKLLGDLDADVVVVEPPGGCVSRRTGPYAKGRVTPETSLWWWHFNTSKRGVVLDLDADGDELRALIAAADIVVEAENPDTLSALALHHEQLRAADPTLIWVSLSPFGAASRRNRDRVTDLTLLAEGGPVWMCGYDDHELPPVRGWGDQSLHTAGLHAVTAVLAAVLHKYSTGRGQHVDVNMLAAANVTTEAATYSWLVAGQTVQRQTCRHAAVRDTTSSVTPDRNGRPLNTGVPPRNPREYAALLDWLDELELRDDFPEAFFLEIGADRGGTALTETLEPGEAREIFRTGRDAMCFIASHLTAYEYFRGSQRHGLAGGIIYAPEEVLVDEHFVARGFPVSVYQPEIDEDVTHLGAPIRFRSTPWQLSRRAPHIGEHDARDILRAWMNEHKA